MSNNVLITGASSGFGRLTAEALAEDGHIVYASICNTARPQGRRVIDERSIAALKEHEFYCCYE